jgi:hypothetical protein
VQKSTLQNLSVLRFSKPLPYHSANRPDIGVADAAGVEPEDLAVHTVFKTGPLANGVCTSLLVPGHRLVAHRASSTGRTYVRKSRKTVVSQSVNAMADAAASQRSRTTNVVAARSRRDSLQASNLRTESSCECNLGSLGPPSAYRKAANRRSARAGSTIRLARSPGHISISLNGAGHDTSPWFILPGLSGGSATKHIHLSWSS